MNFKVASIIFQFSALKVLSKVLKRLRLPGSLNTNWSLSHFIQGIRELRESGEINWRATAASVKTQEDRLFNQGVEHSILVKRENKHFSFLVIFICIENPFPFSGRVFLFLPVTSCYSLIIHCTYLARSECAAQIEYHLVLRSETGNRVEIPSLCDNLPPSPIPGTHTPRHLAPQCP